MIPYGRQSIISADVEAVTEALQSGWLTTGPAVAAFEQAFAETTGAGHAVSCANGTAALHLAALAMRLGDEEGAAAIVPANTFLATANAVRLTGAEVVFADVDPKTGLMLPEHAEEALARARVNNLKVKAVLPVHFAGQTGDPAGLRELAGRHGLTVIEDACHALGSEYTAGGSSYRVGAGAHADMTCFSFHPVKTIATGEGGMVTCTDDALAARLMTLRNHGMSRAPETFENTEMGFDADGAPNPWYYEMPEVGLNYRLSDIHCALGLSQIGRLGAFVARRRELVDLYHREMADLAPVITPLHRRFDCDAGWHLFVALIDFAGLGMSRAALMKALREKEIGTQVHYIPVSRQPYYTRRYGESVLPGVDAYYESCLSLPLFFEMDEADVRAVCDALRSISRSL